MPNKPAEPSPEVAPMLSPEGCKERGEFARQNRALWPNNVPAVAPRETRPYTGVQHQPTQWETLHAAPATQHRVIPVEWHRVAVEPGDNAPARVETRCLDCGVLLEFFNDRWLAFAALGSRAICPKNLKPHRAAQPANTDDRQAETIPDWKEALSEWWRTGVLSPKAVAIEDSFKAGWDAATGRAETRIEVLEAALRDYDWEIECNATNKEDLSSGAKLIGRVRAALAAPSGETKEKV